MLSSGPSTKLKLDICLLPPSLSFSRAGCTLLAKSAFSVVTSSRADAAEVEPCVASGLRTEETSVVSSLLTLADLPRNLNQGTLNLQGCGVDVLITGSAFSGEEDGSHGGWTYFKQIRF